MSSRDMKLLFAPKTLGQFNNNPLAKLRICENLWVNRQYLSEAKEAKSERSRLAIGEQSAREAIKVWH